MSEECDGEKEEVSVEVIPVLEERVREVQEDQFKAPELEEEEPDFCRLEVIPLSEDEYSSLPDLQIQINRICKTILMA